MQSYNIVINDKFITIGKMSDAEKDILVNYFSNEKSKYEALKNQINSNFKKHQISHTPIFLNKNQSSISKFLEQLKVSNFFKKFSSIHLFVHEKGQSSCSKYEVTDIGIKEQVKAIIDFNKLFQSIKKSKNKSFGQASLKGVNFEILGTFLAKNFSLSKHNAILVLSKGDFLPQTENDISEFNNYCISLEFYLEILLMSNSTKEKQALILNLIKSLPLKTEVVFPDKSFHKTSNLSTDQYCKFHKNFALIIKDDPSKESDHVDLFHKDRIRLLGIFLNTLRHEISNPLFGLKLSAQLLQSEDINEVQKEFIAEILLSLDRCSSIIEGFTNLYRSEIVNCEVFIPNIINEVLTLTKSETREILKETKIEDSHTPLVINTNPTWIVQILFNLIINSAHALSESNTIKPKIKISAYSSEKNLLILVEDNGPNVPVEKRNIIFKPFYTTKATGTGLGLPISRNLAKKIGGDLEYIYKNEGACFKLVIPYE